MVREILSSSALILGAELLKAFTTYSAGYTVFNGVFSFIKKHNYPRDLVGVLMRDVQDANLKVIGVILCSVILRFPDRTLKRRGFSLMTLTTTSSRNRR